MAKREPERQEWETEPAFFSWVKGRYWPEIDVCASQQNAKCPIYITKEQDAFETDWIELARRWKVPPRFWCNPGYSAIPEWSKRIWEMTRKHEDALTLLLTHDNYAAEWFGWTAKRAQTRFISPRVQFKPPPGVKATSNARGSILFVFAGNRMAMRFRRGSIGWDHWRATRGDGELYSLGEPCR